MRDDTEELIFDLVCLSQFVCLLLDLVKELRVMKGHRNLAG